MIVRIFAPSVLAKPLNNAQIVRGVFCLYTFEYGEPYSLYKTVWIFGKSRWFAWITRFTDLWQKQSHTVPWQYRLLQIVCLYVSFAEDAQDSPFVQGRCHLQKGDDALSLWQEIATLIFNEIEKIEITIRRAVLQIPADMTGNPFWLTDSSLFPFYHITGSVQTPHPIHIYPKIRNYHPIHD